VIIVEIYINKDEHKPLLHRRDINAKIDFEGATPKRELIRKEFANKLKVKEELILVNRIYNYNGDSGAKIIAHVYDNKDSMKGSEFDFNLKKHGLLENKEAKPEDKKE
jgi:ribosomal protein S24E